MKMSESGTHLLDGITDGKGSGRNMVPLEKFLGKALARLQLCGGARGSERGPTAPREFVDHSQRERQFRADDGQIRLQAVREGRDRVQALQVDGQALRVVGNATVPRRAIKLRNARRLPQLPYQRVLAPTASKDQNFHKPEEKG